MVPNSEADLIDLWVELEAEYPVTWRSYLSDASENLQTMLATKQSEINFLFDEQMKELQRAATLNQSQKDVELIVQRHL